MVFKDIFCIEGIEKRKYWKIYIFFKIKNILEKIRKNHHIAYS
jgi:hypothetical protein